tara:strand:+ start:36905 stop:38080 length:1176 start_codon:yes stop_codon:yes gene_type:complete
MCNLTIYLSSLRRSFHGRGRAILPLLLTSLLLGNSAVAQDVDRIVIFGDSWTDVTVNSPRGPSYAFVMANELGLPITNYAVSGATTSEINDQIVQYLSDGVDPNALHVYWALGNDFTEPGAPADPSEIVEIMGGNAAVGIELLQQDGALYFLVFNVIDNGLRPLAINAGMTAEATALSIEYNDLMQQVANDRNVPDVIYDVFSYFSVMVTDPRFTNTTEGCYNIACGTPDEFVWWDDIHPTPVVQQLIGEEVASYIAGKAPTIVTTAPTSATVGVQYAYTLTALDITPGDSLTYSLVNSPAGMVIDAASGGVTWTPTSTSPATVNVSIEVQDSTANAVQQNFSISVTQTPAPPTPTPTGSGGGGGAITILSLLSLAAFGLLNYPATLRRKI